MSAYKEIKMIYQPSDIDKEVNSELGDGWVVIGIEQQRFLKGDGTSFDDVTHYILGLKDDE